MKSVLIFSGANDRAIIAFCRYAISRNINFAIVANGNEDLIFLTDYKKYVLSTREKNFLDLDIFIQNANLLKAEFDSNEIFVLPSTEFLNRFLLANANFLNEQNISFGLCNSELYTMISDKYKFGDLCHSYNINLPKEYVVKPSNFPYVIKPKTYFNTSLEVNMKPVIIENIEEENLFFSNNSLEELYFQEYVAGKSIYLLFYFFKDKTFSVYSQENLIQQHNGGSMILSKSSNYHLDENLVNQFSNLFISEGFNGLVMVEVKCYKGTYYMIEANPRFWGPSQLILDAKMSLFDDFSIDQNLIENHVSTFDEYQLDIPYFWSGGLVETQKSDSQLMVYDYKKEDYLKEYSNTIKNEIYLRKDTILIYLKENS